MKTIILMLFFMIITPLGAVVGAENRTWVSSNGRFKTEAKLIRLHPDGKRVYLRKANGSEIIVKIELLSQEDQEYIAGNKNSSVSKMNNDAVNPNPSSGNISADQTFEIKEWKEIDPQGMAVFIAKDGTEQKRSCDTFSPKDLHLIIECEIKKNTSDKFFLPEQIRKQINEYCRVNPVKPEENFAYVEDPEIVARNKAKEAEFDRKCRAAEKRALKNLNSGSIALHTNYPDYPTYESTYVSKTTVIDKNLNQTEKTSLCLLLLKYQEMTGEKYSQTDFDSLLSKISTKKSYLNGDASLDIYVLNNILFDFIFWDNSHTHTFVEYVGIINDMETKGELSSGFVNMLEQSAYNHEEESKMKKELMMKKIEDLYPYYNALTGCKHNTEEAKRISKNKSERERENYQKDTNKLFK